MLRNTINYVDYGPLLGMIKNMKCRQNYSKCIEEIRIRGAFMAWIKSYAAYKTFVATSSLPYTNYKPRPNCNMRLLPMIKKSKNLTEIFSSTWTLNYYQFFDKYGTALNDEYWKLAMHLCGLSHAARIKILLKNEIYVTWCDIV